VEFARLKVVLNMNKINVRNVKNNMIITMVLAYLRIVLIGLMISAFLVNKATRTKVEFVQKRLLLYASIENDKVK
jgi:hypothetical protein